MKLQPYVDKLSKSDEFKDFQKKHSDAFAVAGFFVLDLEMGNNLHQIDYYVPSTKKIAAFTLDKQITVQMLELLNNKIPEKLDVRTKTDLDQLAGILEEEMKNRNITENIKKIIAVLQTLEGKKIWNLNCILSGMGILSAHVEDDSRSVLKMEKKNLMDIMKKVPVEEFKKQMNLPPKSKQDNSNQNSAPLADSPATNPLKQAELEQEADQLKEKIKKLDELEQAIEKEKDELEKVVSEKEAKKAKAQTLKTKSKPAAKSSPKKSAKRK